MGPRAPGSSPSWMRASRLPERGSGHLPFPEIYYCAFNRSCESKATGRTVMASSSSCWWRLKIIGRSITYICLQFLQILLMWWNRIINRCLWFGEVDKINLSDKSREDTALKLGLWAQCVNVTSDSWNSAESPVGLWRSRRPYDP